MIAGAVVAAAAAAAAALRFINLHTCVHVRSSATPGKLSAFDDELYRAAEMADSPVVAALTFSAAEGQVTVVREGAGARRARGGWWEDGAGRGRRRARRLYWGAG